jgi:class 3 adenylate cyclase
MFCDLAGSTALSSRLDPEDLREVLGTYHKAVADVVAGFEGYVAKYMGDGVLVYFGYPRAHEDDGERAVRAGLALVERIARLESGSGALACRIGIATGLVVVGDLIGAGDAQERGVVGETPNLASRLQEMAPANGVIIAEATRRLVGNLFEYRHLGTTELKGLATPVAVWQVLRPGSIESRFEALRSGSLTPLVGRDAEMELLLRRWVRAKEGEGQIVLISGEPGIGKSRVAAALQARLSSEPHIRLRYFCSAHHRDSVLYPFIAQLQHAAGFAREDEPAAKAEKLTDCRSAGIAKQCLITDRPTAKARADPRGLGAAIRGTGSTTAGAPRLRGRALGRSDLSGIAGARGRTGAKFARADGHHLPPAIRTALDRPSAGHLIDLEPSRPERHCVAGPVPRRRQDATLGDHGPHHRAHRRYPTFHRGADKNGIGRRPVAGRG